jgi:hypothetical protein
MSNQNVVVKLTHRSNVPEAAQFKKGAPGLEFVTLRKISKGEEILYDYGDRKSAKDFRWLLQ